jgi:hypothetical protein
MWKTFQLLLTLFCVIRTIPARANDPIGEIPAELASPWTTDAKYYLLGGAAATTLLVLFKHQTDDPTQRKFQEAHPLGKFSKLGDYGGRFVPNALYSLGMFADWFGTRDPLALERSEMMLKASLYAVSVGEGLKYAVHEQRPGNGDQKSFPSGHSTAAFAFAGMVAAEHPLPYGIAAFGLATLTGLSRINDNQHYLHDVVAGATIGTAYGLGVSYLHEKHRNEEKTLSPGISYQVVPILSPNAHGAALLAEF